MRAHELATDVALRAGPAPGGGTVERMHDPERGRVRALERGELLAEQDVRLAHVGVEQREPRPVRRVLQRVVDELVEWRDARSAADQRHVFKLVR